MNDQDSDLLQIAEKLPFEFREIIRSKIPENKSIDYYQGSHDFCCTATEILTQSTSEGTKAALLTGFLLELKQKLES